MGSTHALQVHTRGPTRSATAPWQWLQRHCRCGDKDGAAPKLIPPVVRDVVGAPGQTLDPALRVGAETRFGHSFADVRVHADAQAADSARAVSARAYTVGSHVVFGAGQYAPHTREGARLAAHELAHVVQQRGTGSTLQGKSIAPLDDTALEGEADVAADHAAVGRKVPTLSAAGSGLQRESAAGAAKTEPASAPQLPPTEHRDRLYYQAQAFDADLDRSRCLLTITKKIKLNYTDTPSPREYPSGYAPWPPGAKASFEKAFQQKVAERWSGKYALVPNKECPGETCKAVKVAVKIEIVEDGEHNSFELAFRQDRSWPGRNAGVLGSQGHLSSTDIEPVPRKDGDSQVPVEHEIGHTFGLEHVDSKYCLDHGIEKNDERCYGRSGTARENIMGKGSRVDASDYAPFASAMNDIHACGWKVQEPKGTNWLSKILWGGGLGALGAIGVGLLAASGVGALIGGAVGLLGGLIFG